MKGGGVAAVFGFMTTSSGIRMTTQCVIMLYKCVSVCQCLFCVFVFVSASAGSFTLVDIKLFKRKINTSLNSFFFLKKLCSVENDVKLHKYERQ